MFTTLGVPFALVSPCWLGLTIQELSLSHFARENPKKISLLKLSYEGLRTDSSANCRLRSQMFLSVQLHTEAGGYAFPKRSLKHA